MKKILVTGGAGYVGSNLINYLINHENVEVHSLDNYFTGNHINEISGAKYIYGNCKDIESLVDFEPDTIFHLGEYSRVEQSFSDLHHVWDLNMNGIISVLKFAHTTGAKLVYSGSSTKFGDGGLGPGQSPYAWTKASNTDLIKKFSDWYGLDYAIVYFYNVFGRNEISVGKYATLIGIYTEAMKHNKPLGVVKPGSQLRNFTYIDDIISGLIAVGKYGSGDGYGIGSDKSYSVEEVAKLFGGEIQFLPERKGNRMSAEVVTDKTKALGWEPKTDISSYIERLKDENWILD